LIAGEEKELNIQPKKGIYGLKECLENWNLYSNKFNSYYDEIVQGTIDPRIEVIIDYNIAPEYYVPEIEER